MIRLVIDFDGFRKVPFTKTPNKYTLLAPGHYNAEKVQLEQTPAYSFGIKVNYEKVSSTPGKIIFAKYLS